MQQMRTLGTAPVAMALSFLLAAHSFLGLFSLYSVEEVFIRGGFYTNFFILFILRRLCNRRFYSGQLLS